MQIWIKAILSALIIVGTSELAKRSASAAAVLISLPITSILALVWLYSDTKSVEKVISLSNGILLVILPSCVFFIALPLILRQGIRFHWALLLSCAVMTVAYSIYATVRVALARFMF